MGRGHVLVGMRRNYRISIEGKQCRAISDLQRRAVFVQEGDEPLFEIMPERRARFLELRVANLGGTVAAAVSANNA
jgi:hypothetical protein